MLPEDVSRVAPGRSDAERIGRATRFALLALSIAAAGENISACLRLRSAGRVLEDMLGAGSALPSLTVSVLKYQELLIGFACFLPAFAVGLLFWRNIAKAIHTLGIVLILIALQSALVNRAISEPVFEIIRRMQGGGPV